jgi:hypothetical protein
MGTGIMQGALADDMYNRAKGVWIFISRAAKSIIQVNEEMVVGRNSCNIRGL